MSAPAQMAREASNLNDGLLAAKAKAALDRYIDGEEMERQDQLVLEKAEKFLESMVLGARVVKAEQGAGGQATKSVQVLREVLSPLETVRRMSANTDVSAMLIAMASAVRKLSQALEINEADRKSLVLSEKFFGGLYHSLLTTIQQNRRRASRIDGPAPFGSGA